MKAELIWLIMNASTLAVFAWMAVKTGQWWIVLLSIIFKCDLRVIEPAETDIEPVYEDDGRSEDDTPQEIATHTHCIVTETLDPVTHEIAFDWQKTDKTESEVYIDRDQYEKIAHGA